MNELGPFLRTDFKAVDKRDGIHAVMGWIKGDTDKLPIVTDEGKPFGIVNDRAISTGRHLDEKAKLENYALVTRALPETASLEEVAARMSELRAAFLPIEDRKGKLRGYVSAIDVARERGASGRTARELCVPIATLRGEQTVGEALHAFSQEYVDHLPVTDAHGRITGVVRRRDVVVLGANASDKGRMDAIGERRHPTRDALAGFAQEARGLVGPDAGFDEVERALQSWGYALVQNGEGRVLGIVTAETLMRKLAP
jgi:CBS domain-containing protein